MKKPKCLINVSSLNFYLLTIYFSSEKWGVEMKTGRQRSDVFHLAAKLTGLVLGILFRIRELK